MTQAAFVSNTLNTTFHVLADNLTTTSLIGSLTSNCSSLLASSTSTAASSFDPSQPGQPLPEQAVQYYRASSVVLTLDGYNDTAALSSDENAPDIPLPANIDMRLLDCLNQTIGLAVPLVNSAHTIRSAPSVMGMGIILILLLASLI